MANSGAALKISLPDLFRRLWRHLTPRRKRQFSVVMVLIVLSAFAEVVSLGAILPFLGILTSPERFLAYPHVAKFAHAWGIASAHDLVLPFAVAFASAALVAGLFRMLVIWLNTRIAYGTGSDFSSEVYRRTL